MTSQCFHISARLPESLMTPQSSSGQGHLKNGPSKEKGPENAAKKGAQRNAPLTLRKTGDPESVHAPSHDPLGDAAMGGREGLRGGAPGDSGGDRAPKAPPPASANPLGIQRFLCSPLPRFGLPGIQ